jgi:membrane protease YdiL (CAAX protease family)
MLGIEETSDAGSRHRNTKAGPWAWPVILASVLFIGWLINVIPTGALNSEDLQGPIPSASSDLAVLQMQSQAIIASASIDSAYAAEALKTLKEQSRGFKSQAAIVLLEDFIDAPMSDPIASLEVIKEDKNAPEWLEQIERSLSEGIAAEERAVLRSELGWFAELAAEPGRVAPEKSDEIKTRSAQVIVLIMLCMLGVILVILAGGLFLFTLARNQRITGKAFRFDNKVMPRGVMLEAFALYLGMVALGEAAAIVIHGSFSLVGYGLSMVLPLVWPRMRGYRWRPFFRSLGWHRGEGALKEVFFGVIGYSGVLAIASIGICLTWVITLLVGAFAGGGPDSTFETASPQPHPVLGWMFTGGWVEKLFCLLLAAVLAPLLEETLFRGALHRYLRGRLSFFLSALITGAIFAGLHPQGWLAIPALGSMGIGFSLLREWRDSLIAPTVAHAINNGLLIAVVWLAL